MINIEYEKIDEKDEYAISKITTDEKSLYLPDEYEGMKVTRIGRDAFMNASSILVTNLSKFLNCIDCGAFYNCRDLTSVYYNNKEDIDNLLIKRGNSNLFCSSLCMQADAFKEDVFKKLDKAYKTKKPLLIVSDEEKLTLPINEVRIILSEWLYKRSLSYMTYYAEDDFVTYNKCDEQISNIDNCFEGSNCIILDNIDKIENLSNFEDVFNTDNIDSLIECGLKDKYPFIIVTTDNQEIIEKYHHFKNYIFLNLEMDYETLSCDKIELVIKKGDVLKHVYSEKVISTFQGDEIINLDERNKKEQHYIEVAKQIFTDEDINELILVRRGYYEGNKTLISNDELWNSNFVIIDEKENVPTRVTTTLKEIIDCNLLKENNRPGYIRFWAKYKNDILKDYDVTRNWSSNPIDIVAKQWHIDKDHLSSWIYYDYEDDCYFNKEDVKKVEKIKKKEY